MKRSAPLVRRTPLKRGDCTLRRTPLRPVSKKRARENRQYTKLRAAFLAEHPVCQVCDQRRSEQIHHMKRRGANFLVVETWLATCSPCHHAIETNGRWARENGYIQTA